MPRVRQTVHVDRKTGMVTASIAKIEDEASLPRRFEELRAAAMERIPGEAGLVWMGVSCNGCGVEVEVKEPELPKGWSTTPEGDFCEKCS